ncbi:hypothetical protein [Actinophytocola sp.]|uniref:hypothetical protein n=1 Tax=Actinophytocola sp. TaxID=1872138 RepID=UPI002EDAEC2F
MSTVFFDTGADEGSGQRPGMTVSPDKLVQLKQGFEDQRDQVEAWLRNVTRKKDWVTLLPGTEQAITRQLDELLTKA